MRLSEEKNGRLDLLLTDMVMPDMSGAELARLLKAGRPDMKVLFMTGYTDDASALQSDSFGSPVQWMQKPLKPSALIAKVREVLDGAAG